MSWGDVPDLPQVLQEGEARVRVYGAMLGLRESVPDGVAPPVSMLLRTTGR